MKRIFSLVLVLLAAVELAVAQDSRQISTSTIDGSRFEVIQSPLDVAVTFRLDKFTGKIDRLGTCPKDDTLGSNKCWKEMTVFDLPKTDASRIRFQIVINVPQKLTMLMRIDTGQAWQWGIDREERWFPFVECTDRTNINCVWRP